MIRVLHRWPGLVALALVTLLALSGAALSVFPAAEQMAAPQAHGTMSVGELATRIQIAYPGVEQVKRSPSGRVTAYWFDNGTPGSAVVDPATGEGVASADPNPVERWLTNLHRSLFLDDMGRIVSGAGAAAMLVISASGILLVARRAGGWRQWFAPAARTAAGAHPCRARARRRARAPAVLGDRNLDDGLDVRVPSGPSRRLGCAFGDERGYRHAPGRDADARLNPCLKLARTQLPLSGRRDRRLHAQDRFRHGLP